MRKSSVLHASLVGTLMLAVFSSFGCAGPEAPKTGKPASATLTEARLLGDWTGQWKKYRVVLALHSDNKGGTETDPKPLVEGLKISDKLGALVVFEENGTDFPVVGKWTLKGNAVTIFSAGPRNGEKPLKIRILEAGKNGLLVVLLDDDGKPSEPIRMHPATAKERKALGLSR
jgi:hypothetical protein